MKKLNVLLAAAAIALCTAAQADTHGQQPAVSVHYSLTAVTTASGVKKLYEQLYTAARFVCGQIDSYPLPPTLPRFDVCVRQTLSQAVMRVHQPALTAYAAARGVAAGPTLADVARAQ